MDSPRERYHIGEKTPTAWIMTAVIGGVLFILGGIATSASTTPRLVMAAGATSIAALGIYAIRLIRDNLELVDRQTELMDEVARMRQSDASLRSRMAYTLRDPLTSIVGFADQLVESPDLPPEAQREMLVAIRHDAREVEQTLSELSSVDPTSADARQIEAVVLLDEEVRSIASTTVTATVFEFELAQTRAWGDSAKARQIIRTMLTAATDSGCANITLRTSVQSGRATASISGRDDLLSIEGISALTGNTVAADRMNDAYVALRSARETAASMLGSIGYVEAFGVSHIILDLPLAPTDLGVAPTGPDSSQRFALGLPAARNLGIESSTDSASHSTDT